MKEHKFKVVVMKDGRVVVDDVPVTEGEEVEVTIRIEDPVPVTYPLFGLPFRYIEPFEPAVDPSEWDALK
ncbi:MAG: hypothetical protein QOC81_4315 [Thermoanaerobaculia bacterium]|jgi:hypothetical protein|nr:hypothetical protein [Thermoanaerobaculia bacterium]